MEQQHKALCAVIPEYLHVRHQVPFDLCLSRQLASRTIIELRVHAKCDAADMRCSVHS